MTGCNTGRNIQKYKGSGGGASTLQEALENSNVATLDINLISGAVYIGDGGGLSNINASAVAGNLQAVTDNSATTTNKITLTNGVTSLETTGNVLITGNVTAGNFLGDGGTLSNIAASKDFQEVTDLGATSSNKITLTNSGTSLETSGNIELGHASDTTIARSSAGVVTIEGNEIRTGTVPITKGGTGVTSSSAAATALGVGTGNSPQFTAIQLGHASDTTLARSSAGVVTIEGNEIRTGTVPIAKGGTGVTSSSAAATALGVGTGNSPQFTAIQLGHASDTTLARSGAGVVTIEGNEIRTGTVPIAKGGTGTTSLNNLITMGSHTTGNFVQTITGGNGITSSGATSGENIAHSLSVDAKANGGLVIESNKLAVNLGASTITGTLAVSDGGTGATSLNNLITMGSHTTGNFVQTITGGNGITSSGATSGENIAHSLSVDAKANGGLVIESNKLAVDLGASSITGTLAVGDGGTGTTSLNNLITMGSHTTGNFVQTITGGDGITSSGATSGENIAHSLSVDAKANGGLVIESNKLAVKLDASSITGKLAASDGGTGNDSYTTGQILVANGTSSLIKLTPGTSGHFLQSQGAGSALVWKSVSNIGSATPGELIMGDFLTGGPHTGATDTTIRALGNVSNLSNQLVARDDKGDIFVSNVNAIRIYGDGTFLTGVALSTDLASNSTRIGTLSTDLASNSTRIGTISTDLASNSTRIGTIDTDLASNSTRIGTLSTDLASNSTRIGTLSTDLASNSTRIGTLSTDLASNSTRIGTISTDLASNSTRITNLQNSTIISNSSGITDAFETGDLIYASGQNTLSNLSIGTASHVLTVSGGIPTWVAASSSGTSYWTQDGTKVYYNDGNVGIGTTAPVYALDVNGDIRTTSEGGFRGNGGNISGISIQGERNNTIINFGQQSSLKKSANGAPV